LNFDLTPEQKEIQRAADEFARGEFDKDVALELDRNHQYPFEIVKKACSLGFVNSLSRDTAAKDMGSLKMP
jgi:alkylation response protein AidB-like acyl-CoA dehydrogenase